MAEFLKTIYTGSFCDKNSNNIIVAIQKRYPTDIGVIPQEIIFSGEEDVPVSISFPDQGDYKLTPLNGSECVVNIKAVNDFELASLYPNDEREYKIIIGGDQYSWQGFMLPDNVSEPFISKPYNVTIRATDGLGVLQDEPFLFADGVRYKGWMRDDVLLRTILAKTGLSLPMLIAVNTYEENMTPGVCPLSQLYSDTDRYYDEEGKPYSCKDVLEALLRRWNARLHQWNGQWQIVNALEMSFGSTLAYLFDANGNYLEYDSIGDVVYGGGQDYEVRPTGLTYLAKAVKSSTSFYEYGYPTNELVNGDFDDWDGLSTLPENWQASGGAVANTQYRVDQNTGLATTDVYITITDNGGGGYILNNTTILIRANESVNLTFDLYAPNAISPGNKAIDIFLHDVTNSSYFTENNGWQGTSAFYRAIKSGSDMRNQVSVSVDLTAKSVDYELEIGLRGVSPTSDPSFTFPTSINNAQIRQSIGGGLTRPGTGALNTQTQTLKQSFKYDSILMLHSDETNELRTSRLAVILDPLTPTSAWERRYSAAEDKPLQHIVANTELVMHSRPYRVFDGQFYGSGYVDINTIFLFDETAGLPGIYTFLSGTFDLKSGIHQLKFAEALTDEPAYIEEQTEYYGEDTKGDGLASSGGGQFATSGNYVDLSGYAKMADVPVKSTSLETQTGTNDTKFTTPLTIANWWAWVRGQVQTISAVWNFTSRPTFNGVGLITAADVPKASDNMLTKSAAYTVLPADFGTNGNCTIFVDTTSGSVAITLPSATLMNGYTLHVIKVSADLNSVVVTATINGIVNDILSSQYDAGTYKSSGTGIFKF